MIIIEEALTFGIGVEEDLEAPVESKPFHAVGAHASPRLIGGLEKTALASGPGEGEGAAKAGEASANNGYVEDRLFHVLEAG